MADLNHTTTIPGNHEPNNRGFGASVSLLGVMALAALLAQNLNNWRHSGWTGILGAAAIMLAYLAVFYKPLNRNIDTPFFATSGLLAIALGTALGTFVTQNAPAEVFTQRYGELGSNILRWLQLDDVFHSWWYIGLFVLLSASLLKISLRRKFNMENLGFYLAHLGPIIILAGFWVDYFYGFRGIIQLETGQSTNVARIYEGSTNYIKDSTELAFRLRLDDFEFEKHDPDYRIQIWRNTTEAHAQPVVEGHMPPPASDPEIVASLPLKLDKTHRIYGTDVRFRLKDFYPNFKFDYVYPAVNDTVEARDPGVLLTLKTPLGEGDLQLLSNRPDRNAIADETHLGAWLEFYWDMPEELSQALNGQPDAKWAEVKRVILVGTKKKIYHWNGKEVSSKALETGQYYAFPDKEDIGFTVRYLFPDAAYLKSVPATDGDELLNPVARVEVWDKSWPSSKEAYLYPGGGSRGGLFMIPGTPYFLALESIKDRETKYWKSTLSVLGANDDVLKSREVKVNEPMLHGGYRFYQTDYDPNNPNYSGIGISREPGLYVIYFGFGLLVIGCFLLFYGRHKRNTVPLVGA
ncbi:MAG: cytochrome c biogenesis protein ResB [Phaeodactylibacter sp.]|nr:cytochrome c biogenesis protein ResB [Phaeodactylibacter sp.]MCB9300001.1 cytochrome c biogenesis protein ResB [Lewinellaceae bacterium]